MIRKYCKEGLAFAAAMMSFLAFADQAAAKAARRFATGGDVSSFHYADAAGVGWTAFVHTFTNTAAAKEFRNMSGKTLPVRMLVVGGGGAGMDGIRVATSSTARRPGGGGGGGGGVTETNAFLSADDVWIIRVGAGGTVPSSHGQDKARGEAGQSSVSNGFVEVVSVPGGGAGGSRVEGYRPTVGASGGGGSGSNVEQAAGAEGNYTNSVGGVLYGPYSGGSGGPSWESSYGGGGGGAGARGNNAVGGEGLTNDITGVSVVYGSGGGGGGHSRLNREGVPYRRDGGVGGTNAGDGGNCEWDIVDDGATTNIVVTKASAPVANTGSGGAGGVSFGGGANFSDYGTAYTYATAGADGVVIIRYDIPDTPCLGGDVVTVMTNGFRVTYIHKFTNTTEAATFKPSVAFDGTSVRMLVVGGGGAGMDGSISTPTARRPGGGGGGGGGVTETNAFLLADDIWTIRVGAGGKIPSRGQDKARGEAGTSSVSNGFVEVVSVPGGGAGGSKDCRPTVGAAGGGGSGGNDTLAVGAEGNYTNSVGGVLYGPYSGGNGGTSWASSYGGGGGGAGAAGVAATGGEGLTNDITGVSVVYGSGGGGGGHSRVDKGYRRDGGSGGTNAGRGGNCKWDIVDDGATTNVVVTKATAPIANTGAGGAGGVSFGGGANVSDYGTAYTYATAGADGVVIIRYEADLPRPKGFLAIFQ